jgi:hypothetical protein
MIEVLPESHANILGVKALDKLTDLDYKDVLIPKLEQILSQHGKARILFDMGEEFHGWELAAAWDDAKFGIKHRNDFEKCAVVGGPKWVEWATKLGALLMNGEVKTFPSNQLKDAWEWVQLQPAPIS